MLKSYRLGTLVRIRTGKLDANANSPEGEYPFFTCSKNTLRIKSYSYDTECVLVAGNGDLNVKYYKGKFDAYQRTYIVESLNEEVLNTRYLYWYLEKYVEKLRKLSIGGVIKYIKLNNLTEPYIPLPSIEEQQRIVEILDQADLLRQKRKEAIDLLDDYLAASFIELFGDLRSNTKGLVEMHLSELAEIRSGVTKGRKLDESLTVEVPYMRVANVQDGYISLDEVKTISVLPKDVDKYRLEEGDILLTEGGDPDKLGRGGVWQNDIKDCIHQNHIFRVRLDQSRVLPEYASALIGSPYGKSYFLRVAKQTTGIATINSTQLKKFPFLLADMKTQALFASKTQAVAEIRKTMLEQSLELDNQFNALMQNTFSGEL